MKVTVQVLAADYVSHVFPTYDPAHVLTLENLRVEDGVKPESKGWSVIYRAERLTKGLPTKEAAVEFATKWLEANIHDL